MGPGVDGFIVHVEQRQEALFETIQLGPVPVLDVWIPLHPLGYLRGMKYLFLLRRFSICSMKVLCRLWRRWCQETG